MNQTIIKRSLITISDRFRKDYGDLQTLADSIKQYGLIHPPVIDQNNRLVAGGRRIAACDLLGLEEIPVVYKETLSEEHLKELELEENVRRKDVSWQEKTLVIAEIHELKKRKGALAGTKWGLRETGELIGQVASRVQYAVEIANKLKAELDDKQQIVPHARYWKCDNFSDAWKLRLRDEQDALMALEAKEQCQSPTHYVPPTSLKHDEIDLSDLVGLDESPLKQEVQTIAHVNTPYSQLTKDQARERYLSNPLNPPNEFEEYYKQKLELDAQRYTLSLSDKVLNVDCIEYMLRPENKERFDHCITDPPYGIDMEMLAQQNTGMVDIDTTSAEHVVEENEDLFTKLFSAVHHCLKPNAFFILWSDIMQWQRLYDLAVKNGFKVQRWPITWVKLHRCMNQAAQFNFTKSTEIAMVCRKGSAVLMQPASECHINAAHDDYKEILGHPFVKPFEVWEYLAKHVSFDGQLIIEPFSGRGSGPISFLRMNRRVVALEKNPEHYNALLHNIKEHYRRINPNFQFI